MGAAILLGGGVLLVGGGTTTLSRKTAVRVATTGDLPAATLSGGVLTANANGALAAQDGVALAVDDRLLHLGATTASLRLIYQVTDLGSVSTPWVLTVAPDASDGARLLAASDVWVAGGDTYPDTLWELTTDAPITVGTTSLAWQQTSGAGAPAGTGLYTVDASVAVRDAVYASGSGAAAKASAASIATMPCIGFVASKPTTTTAIVQPSGELGGFTGLTSNTTYYPSPTTAGAITTTAPTTAGQVVQRIGFAKTATVLSIEIDRDMVEL